MCCFLLEILEDFSHPALPDCVIQAGFKEEGGEMFKVKDSLFPLRAKEGVRWLVGCRGGGIGCYKLFPTTPGFVRMIYYAEMFYSGLQPTPP